MLKISKIITSFLAIGLSGVSFLAHADDLNVVNNTSKYATASINKTGCSSDMGIIVEPHSPKKIDSSLIDIACLGHAKNCKAEVYMGKNCDRNGEKRIALVLFDTSKGIKSISMDSNQYKITGKGFTVQVDGGPNSK